MLEGKADLLESCRLRKMKTTEKSANLLETRVKADGLLDGMDVRVDINCISGMPGESSGSITFRGNLAQLMSVLDRVWPTLQENREIVSPGRQHWPDKPSTRKEPKKPREPKQPKL